VQALRPEDVDGLIGDADVVFGSEIRAKHLEAAHTLRWIHSPAAGVGSMLFPEMVRSPVVISNSRGMSGAIIAEHVLGLTVALFRKFPLAFRSQASHRWAQDESLQAPPLRMVRSARVLLVGLGGIGRACAALFAAFGAEVTATRRRVDQPTPEGVARVAPPDQFLDLLPDADIVVLTAPQTRDTVRLIGERELRAMKERAILINVSRGKLVDEPALAAALRDGRIGGAGLDVFEHEPLDPASQLWDLPNVIITPHTAGFRPDHWDAATTLFIENLRRYEAGRPLLNLVDKHAGY
jgi:phosphoglycerate dehydrogenase-like enzyme